jgi:hypothetical protein
MVRLFFLIVYLLSLIVCVFVLLQTGIMGFVYSTVKKEGLQKKKVREICKSVKPSFPSFNSAHLQGDFRITWLIAFTKKNENCNNTFILYNYFVHFYFI